MLVRGILLLLFSIALPLHAWAARDAAFMTPGGGVMGAPQALAVTVEPRNEIEVGDTPINLGRRATFFFVNRTNAPIKIEAITINGDSNVQARIVSDDCSPQKIIAALSRCAVTVEAIPTASGSWGADLMMTHDAPERLTRARVTGRTNERGQQKTDTGLSLSTKMVSPIDFNDVEVGTDRVVRSALMVNDSQDAISLLDIEVIAPENGLERFEQGCVIDMELNAGESCPITLMWQPRMRGIISTDLIIRHTGRMGFVVIPIRGKAVDPKDGPVTRAAAQGGDASDFSRSIAAPALTSADAVQRALQGDLPGLQPVDLPESDDDDTLKAAPRTVDLSRYHLIGTVGHRAILYMPDGKTSMLSQGDEIPLSRNEGINIVSVSPREAVLEHKGKKRTLPLTSVAEIKRRSAVIKATEQDSKETEERFAKEEPKTALQPSSVKLPVNE